MQGKNESPAEVLADFLAYIAWCEEEYQRAYEAVHHEDMRLQDLLHELEFSADAKERNRVAKKFRDSRRTRRENKDVVLMLGAVVEFFKEPQRRKVLNQMRDLMGCQRKTEKMLASERVYRPRAGE